MNVALNSARTFNQQITEKMLASRKLNADILASGPSFGYMILPDDTSVAAPSTAPLVSFFDFYGDEACNPASAAESGGANCLRTFTLTQQSPTGFEILIDDPTSGGAITFPPESAYNVPAAASWATPVGVSNGAYSGLNYQHFFTGNNASYLTQNGILLLNTTNEFSAASTLLAGQVLPANAAGTSTVPRVEGILVTPAGGDVNYINPTLFLDPKNAGGINAASAKLMAAHPLAGNSAPYNFSTKYGTSSLNSVDTFFRSLPTVANAPALVKVRGVKIVRYTIEPTIFEGRNTTELVRYEWSPAINNFPPPTQALHLQKDVVSVTFSRPNMSSTLIQVQMSVLPPKVVGVVNPSPVPIPYYASVGAETDIAHNYYTEAFPLGAPQVPTKNIVRLIGRMTCYSADTYSQTPGSGFYLREFQPVPAPVATPVKSTIGSLMTVKMYFRLSDGTTTYPSASSNLYHWITFPAFLAQNGSPSAPLLAPPVIGRSASLISASLSAELGLNELFVADIPITGTFPPNHLDIDSLYFTGREMLWYVNGTAVPGSVPANLSTGGAPGHAIYPGHLDTATQCAYKSQTTSTNLASGSAPIIPTAAIPCTSPDNILHLGAGPGGHPTVAKLTEAAIPLQETWLSRTQISYEISPNQLQIVVNAALPASSAFCNGDDGGTLGAGSHYDGWVFNSTYNNY
jgi:hypothetical protein